MRIYKARTRKPQTEIPDFFTILGSTNELALTCLGFLKILWWLRVCLVRSNALTACQLYK